MNSSRLRELFTRVLRASLASPLVLAGCGGLDLDGYSPPDCINGKLSVRDLSPSVPTDFIELRRVYSTMMRPPFTESALSSSGVRCVTATDGPSCRSELKALTSTTGFGTSCGERSLSCVTHYLATTQGDVVTAHNSLEALLSFLGTIDTPQEAVLRVVAEGDRSYQVSCSELEHGAVKANADGTYNVVATTGTICAGGGPWTQHVLLVSPEGEVRETRSEILEKGPSSCDGRRPAGLRSNGVVDCSDALGHHFAIIAHMEAASIQAFLRLREELALHGAGVELQDAALRSAMEEVAHAEVCGRLARKHGATPSPAVVAALPPRPLAEVVLDNAVEGCVRETYGALVAYHQALHAEDSEVREAMARIAEDETRHADLSWAIDRWASTRLPESERTAVREAQVRAVEALRAQVAEPTDAALIRELGLPSPEVAVALVDTLARELWN
ncbi:ferritin-like domain-containing protein [Myxococcus sp. CA033]|uniref:ferritin-like domain-containing protein n=1 Tax=Myxococcus sp. CA033 TaxID=2741516 RepID=UPI00157AA8DB|nr:ferritin-like domain-containing protein [Myxococcus sp. CA033]NTX41570.1 ferritin-like domain-containing protein [Myxococcus sp. CA033]